MKCVVLAMLATALSAKPCSYQLPNIDEIVTGVEIDARIENDGHRTKRAVHHARSDHFQPMRIHLHLDETILSLSDEKLDYVKHTLLPNAIGFWEKVLRVRRHKSNLLLKRKCNETFFLWDKSVRQLACGKGCAQTTTCGDSIVPTAHLQPCHYCEYRKDDTTDRCATEGVAGEGIPETDFVLYVSSKQSERCIRNDTLAYAAHCQQEALLDRPIAGHVNLCPSALSTHTHDQEVLISTVKHEVLHALGFSAGLYAFFRDDDGKPRTKRNQYGRPFNMNPERSHFKWDKTTIDTLLRMDWWTAEGPVVHPVQMMVTARVRNEARRHFGCPTLEGAELENQGGDGTAITHWEKRIFENEAMTGTHTQNPVYSRMTFALLEDTGWYRVNYSMAEDLHWGAGLGCDFVKKSCGEWIAARKANRTSFSPFCDHVKHDGRRSLVVTKCNLQRDSVALCNLIPYGKKLPIEFRNLDAIPGVQKAGLPYYGGSVELADYCPYNQEFEWKIASETEKRRDSRCEIETNRLENDELMEVYGHDSRCFDFLRPWTEKKCGKIRTFHQYMAGCYEHSCAEGVLHIGLFNSTTLYPCRYEGQHVHIRKITDEGWLREGTLLCPPCSELCSECKETKEGTIFEDFVGDPPIDEPCSAHSLSLLINVIMVTV
ncbi:hypothetical protein PFISCL1PPCAC_8545, partial [Pristionchus fissidentatus]